VFGISLHLAEAFPSRALWPGFMSADQREMWVRGGWILMFAAYHAVQCAAKCDVTAMRVSFCGMDGTRAPRATPSRPPAHTNPRRSLQGRKEETPCAHLGARASVTQNYTRFSALIAF
jgi:hypothetical protein